MSGWRVGALVALLAAGCGQIAIVGGSDGTGQGDVAGDGGDGAQA
jgi:hypothetical protein